MLIRGRISEAQPLEIVYRYNIYGICICSYLEDIKAVHPPLRLRLANKQNWVTTEEAHICYLYSIYILVDSLHLLSKYTSHLVA